MINEKLVALSALRRGTVQVAGETLHVRQPSLLEEMEYNERKATSQEAGFAYLFFAVVTDAEGKRVFTEDEALQVASGNSSVSGVLLGAILGLSDREKKDSPPSSASSTGSPSPSAAPSKSSKRKSAPPSSPTGKPSPR